jgi:hypothetical protein
MHQIFALPRPFAGSQLGNSIRAAHLSALLLSLDAIFLTICQNNAQVSEMCLSAFYTTRAVSFRSPPPHPSAQQHIYNQSYSTSPQNDQMYIRSSSIFKFKSPARTSRRTRSLKYIDQSRLRYTRKYTFSLRVKCLVFLSHLNHNRRVSTNF